MGICRSICESPDPKQGKEQKQDTPAQNREEQLNSPKTLLVRSPSLGPRPRIALKAPHGKTMQHISEGKWVQEQDINRWLALLYYQKKFTDWILYNDEPPGENHSASSSHGH